MSRDGAAKRLLECEDIRIAVGQLLSVDPSALRGDTDLIEQGIDSIQIMRVVSMIRRAGIEVTFSELIERPTLDEWWTVIEARSTAVPVGELGHRDEGIGDGAGGQRVGLPFGLTPIQEAYVVGRRPDQILGGVSAQFYIELDGYDIDAARLERAARGLLDRHPMLRARFPDDESQLVLPKSPWPGVTVHDLREGSRARAEQLLAGLRDRLSSRLLDVGSGEVFDLQLSLLADGKSRLHLNMDMLVSDAQSFRIIVSELVSLYFDPENTLAPVRISFQRYLEELAERRALPWKRAQDYWRQREPELPGAPQLPLATAPDELVTRRSGRRHHWLPPADRHILAQKSRAHRLTLAVVLATAFAEVIGAWSAEPKFLLNVPVFDRELVHPDVTSLVGDFTNVIMLSVDVEGDLPFADRAQKLGRQLRADLAQAAYSGVHVLRDLARSRPGDWMMAPVVFTSAIGMGELFGGQVKRLGELAWLSSQTPPQVWLDHQVIEHDGGLLLNWDVVENLFQVSVVDAMFDAYVRLLRWLSDPGSDWDNAMPDLLPSDQAEKRAIVNSTRDRTPEQALHEGFFARAAEHPDHVALRWADDGQITYGSLADQARRVAHTLRGDGIRAGDAVAVTMPKGASQVCVTLGILAAGGVYVPVGIDQPAWRRAQICQRAGARVIVTETATRSAFDWPAGLDVVTAEALANGAHAAELLPVSLESLAYVIHTSGSTGAPKGVEISHRSAVNTINDINERFSVDSADSLLALSALDFDLSVYDIFGPLSAGGATVLATDNDRHEPHRCIELVQRHSVTVWNSVPALLNLLLTSAESTGHAGDGSASHPLRSLRVALVSGDWVPVDLAERLARQCPDCLLVALGGATEAAIWSNAFEVRHVLPGWRSVPYGYPLRNQHYRVADGRRRDCPDWVPGELWIGGMGVARGYRGQPDITAARFVEHNGERWYRTGDIGRYRPGGVLEFLGRADDQVKLRGHRIELGEIESALQAHPQVTRAVAIVTAGVAAGPGNAAASARQPLEQGGRIAAAVIAPDGVNVAELRPFAANRLPTYMLPDEVVIVDELPLSANGKVDRRALAELIATAMGSLRAEPPRGPVETALARLWSELLSARDVGRTQNFFSLGGDSLLATRMIESLQHQLGVSVSLKQLFVAPTIAELAAMIDRGNQQPANGVEEGII